MGGCNLIATEHDKMWSVLYAEALECMRCPEFVLHVEV